MNHHRSASTLLILTALSIVAGCVAWAASRGSHHFVTTDSCGYLSNALNLNQGRGYTTDVARWDSPGDHQLIPFWPPVVPLCIAGLDRVEHSVERSGLLLSAICFGLLVGATGLVASRISGCTAGALAALACLVFWPVFSQSIVVMTEMPFTALSMLALYCCLRAGESGRIGWLLATTLFVALTTMTRYIGVAQWVVFAGWCGWLARRRSVPWSAWVWPVLAGLPLAIWLLRNHLIYGGLIGHTVPASAGFVRNLLLAIRVSIADFLPIPHLGTGLGGRAKMAIAVAVAVGVFACGLRGVKSGRRVIWLGSTQGTLLACVYAVAYLVMLAALAAVRGFDPINTRLTMPAYPAILVILSIAALSFGGAGSGLRALAATCSVVWLLLAVTVSLQNGSSYTCGTGTSGHILHEPGAIFLRRLNAPRVASDNPARVWYITRRPTRYLPDPADQAAMNSILKKHGLVIALFRNLDWRSSTIAGEADLRAAGILARLRLLSRESDCDIYQVP